MTKTVPHPTLPFTITFDSTRHTYRDDHAQIYTSGTAFVKSYFPPFDSASTAARVSARTGKPVHELLAEWSSKAQASSEFGTYVHAYAEALVLGLPRPAPRNDAERRAFAMVDSALSMLKQHYDILGAEQIIFDPLYLIAGQIDLPCRNKETGAITIIDWKTCEDITSDAYGQTGLAPIAHIPNSKVAHYELQTSLYGFILVDPGYSGYPSAGEPLELACIHLPHTGTEPVWRPMVYRRDEVAAMVEQHMRLPHVS